MKAEEGANTRLRSAVVSVTASRWHPTLPDARGNDPVRCLTAACPPLTEQEDLGIIRQREPHAPVSNRSKEHTIPESPSTGEVHPDAHLGVLARSATTAPSTREAPPCGGRLRAAAGMAHRSVLYGDARFCRHRTQLPQPPRTTHRCWRGRAARARRGPG